MEDGYGCPECSNVYLTFEETQQHCLTVHNIEIEDEVDDVDVQINSVINKKATSNIIFACKNSICKSNNAVFNTFDEYEDHLNLIHGAFKCIGCDTRYKRVKSYENHVKKFHDGIEPTEFTKKTRTRKTASYKSSTTKKEKNDGVYYSCQFCPKIYASKNSLHHHYTLKHENDDDITSIELDKAIKRLIDM